MKKTIDKFVYLIVVAAVISSIYSIYVWSRRGGFELLIIDRINRTLFIISMYVYYRKGKPVMLLFMAAMVILLALGIFMPMWDLGNAVQGRK